MIQYERSHLRHPERSHAEYNRDHYLDKRVSKQIDKLPKRVKLKYYELLFAAISSYIWIILIQTCPGKFHETEFDRSVF